jgi:predicted RNase H-like HicB family nuclease
MEFKVIMELEKDGGYSVHCPVLKGCHSQGQTVEEALANIKESIEGCSLVQNEKPAPNLN